MEDVSEERESRPLARNGSLKRRDASWDKKWQEHLGKNVTEDLPRSSIFTRSPRLPGKVNRSVWESRLAQEADEAAKQLPRTPPPTMRRFPTQVLANSPTPKPHHGACMIDYSPSRTATPPYPSGTATPDCKVEDLPPLPDPPKLVNESVEADCKVDQDLPLPPPEACAPELLNDAVECSDWKDEMREEILRARQNLLSSQDSGKVESVIRLLEQTYQRLHNDPEVTIEAEHEESLIIKSPSLHELNGEENRAASKMECLFDEDELTTESKFKDEPREPNALTRSVSGTFQAVPARVIEADEDDNSDTEEVSQTFLQNNAKSTEKGPDESKQLAKDRRDFCHSMLTENFSAMIDKTKERKFDLMDEIRKQVPTIPAVDEVFQTNHRKPVVLTDTLIFDQSPPLKTSTEELHQTKEDFVIEYEGDQTARMLEENHALQISDNSKLELFTPLNETESTVHTAQSGIFEDSIKNYDKEVKEQMAQIMEDVKPQVIEQIVPDIKPKEDIQEHSILPVEEEIQLQVVEQTVPEIKPVEKVQDEIKHLKHGHTLPRHFSPGASSDSSSKLKMFEAAPREKVFSISGIWSQVSLGLVKERSTFWQDSGKDKPLKPNYIIQKQKKRSSRVIDPNEWVMAKQDMELPPPSKPPLHKSLSVGQLDVEDKEEEPMPISQATVAFEARANGRKSADIFVHNAKAEANEKVDKVEATIEVMEQCKSIKAETKQEVFESQEARQFAYEDIKTEYFEIKTASKEVTEEKFETVQVGQTCHQDEKVVKIEQVTQNGYQEKKVESKSETFKSLDQASTEITTKKPEKLARSDQLPPVPHRNSSMNVVKKKTPVSKPLPTPPPPSLTLLTAEIIDADRALELAKHEEAKRRQQESEKRAKMLQEQERKFYEKFEISQQYRSVQQKNSQGPPPPPPPPKVDYEKPKGNQLQQQQRLEKLKAQELKERMKLKEMERRKKQIEEEIEREKQHLANLLRLELNHSPKLEQQSPLPPPVPPRPTTLSNANDAGTLLAEQDSAQPTSLEETVRDLEMTTLQLKTMAEKRSAENDEALRQTAGTVREVAQALLQAVNNEDVEDDNTEGYSEGGEDFSCGIEMTLGGTEQSSGNITPVPTQGELEEISVEEPSHSRRSTPLKSLLKRNYDASHEDTISLPEEPLITTVRERSCSPRKAVHFSEIDQIKLMSQESLVSTAPSDSAGSNDALTVNATQVTCSTQPIQSYGVDPVVLNPPKRNQRVL